MDQRATERQEEEEATEELLLATAAKDTEGERRDMAEVSIRHQLLEGMGNNRVTVSLLGQMKTLANRRCVLQFATSVREDFVCSFLLESFSLFTH